MKPKKIHISKREVFAYREIYNNYILPAILNDTDPTLVELILEVTAIEFGMTPERYTTLAGIDLIQRLDLEDAEKLVKLRNSVYSVRDIKEMNLPILRSPKRS